VSCGISQPGVPVVLPEVTGVAAGQDKSDRTRGRLRPRDRLYRPWRAGRSRGLPGLDRETDENLLRWPRRAAPER
jgi:hypothetical protein